MPPSKAPGTTRHPMFSSNVVCRGADRGPPVVVQNNGPTGPDDLAEEIEINQDLVEPVAAVDERRVGGEALGEESWKRD